MPNIASDADLVGHTGRYGGGGWRVGDGSLAPPSLYEHGYFNCARARFSLSHAVLA